MNFNGGDLFGVQSKSIEVPLSLLSDRSIDTRNLKEINCGEEETVLYEIPQKQELDSSVAGG